MTADDFRKCRLVASLGVVEYGWAIGYRGTPNTISRLIRSFEEGTKVPPTYIQNLAIMYWRHGIPDEMLSPHALETRRAQGLAR